MSWAWHTVTLQNGYLTVGITSADTTHEAPPYLMRVASVVIIMKGLCLWTTVFSSKNVHQLMFTVPLIGPRRHRSKCQALTGSYPSCRGRLLPEARGSCLVDNADLRGTLWPGWSNLREIQPEHFVSAPSRHTPLHSNHNTSFCCHLIWFCLHFGSLMLYISNFSDIGPVSITTDPKKFQQDLQELFVQVGTRIGLLLITFFIIS